MSPSDAHTYLRVVWYVCNRLKHSLPSKLYGSVWEIVLGTPAFWDSLGDFEYIGLLARTACAFRLAVQWNATAWLEISKRVPLMSNASLSEVFAVSGKEAAFLRTYHCYDVAKHLVVDHTTPLRRYLWRRERIRLRAKRGRVISKTRWPDDVLFRRFDRLLLGVLACAWKPSVKVIFMSNRQLTEVLLDAVHAHVSMRLKAAIVHRYLYSLFLAHNTCFERRWHANIMMWRIDVPAIFAALRPLTHTRLLRELACH